jgi:hypothetical protein
MFLMTSKSKRVISEKILPDYFSLGEAFALEATAIYPVIPNYATHLFGTGHTRNDRRD